MKQIEQVKDAAKFEICRQQFSISTKFNEMENIAEQGNTLWSYE